MNGLQEKFIRNYYEMKYLLQPDKGAGENMFDVLASIFALTKSEKTEIYKLIGDADLEKIDSLNEYERFCRVKQYVLNNGLSEETDVDFDAAADIRGNIFQTMNKNKISSPKRLSAIARREFLEAKASCGSVAALRSLGIGSIEGIACEKDPSYGLKMLRKAADWNDLASLMALMIYAPDENTASVLSAVSSSGTLSDRAKEIIKRSNVRVAGGNAEAKMLEKAFARNLVSRDMCVYQVSDVVHAENLSVEQKEKALFSGSAEEMNVLATLPLNVKSVQICDCAEGYFRDGRREAESKKIFTLLKGAAICCADGYRPLCIVSDCPQVRKTYAEYLETMFSENGVHTALIDVDNITESDLGLTSDHVLTRFSAADKANALIFLLGEEVPQEIKNMLRADYRANFRIVRPSVSINLGNVLPVCIAPSSAASGLSSMCNIFSVADMSGSEFEDYLSSVADGKKKLYSIGNITFTGKATKKLREYGTVKAESVIDSACGSAFGVEELKISEAVLSAHEGSFQPGRIVCGFGEKQNEIRKLST